METININPMHSSRSRRISYHKDNARRVRSIDNSKNGQYYNYNGIRSITVILAVVAFTFALFMYSVAVSS